MLAVAEHPTTQSAEAAAHLALANAGYNRSALDKATARRDAYGADAARAAPAAITAATTRCERDLITRIFEAIPNVLALSQAHSEAEVLDEQTEDAKWAAWEAGRAEVEALAREVVSLPAETAGDALRRVKLYRQVLAFTESGPAGDDFEGLLDEDIQIMGNGAIAALEALASREPDRTEWDASVKALRDAEWRLRCATREEDGHATAAFVEDHVRESLKERLNAAYADRDTARTQLLAMDPPDVGGLLIQMEIVFDHASAGDVSTYATRARLRGDEPVTAERLWRANEDDLRSAFGLLATNAAKLKDQSLSAGWREVIEGVGVCHPNLRDAVDQAVRAGLDPQRFAGIQLSGAQEDDLPILTFKGPADEFVYARPSGCWFWQSVGTGEAREGVQ